MSTSMDIWFGGNKELIWDKFCGYLHLSLPAFMHIQESLLMEQIKLLQGCELGRKLLGNQKINSVEDFRRKVPLTTYSDYEPYLSQKREDVLPAKLHAWAITTGRGGIQKWVPLSSKAFDVWAEAMLGLFILSTASKEKKFSLKPGNVMFNIAPPRPFFAGIGIRDICKRVGLRLIPPDNDEYNKLPFFDGVAKGFQMALYTGIDLITALGSLVVSSGQFFKMPTLPASSFINAKLSARIIRGLIKSKAENGNIRPAHLWKLKGLLATGADLPAFHQKIKYYWGIEPFEFYINSECSCFIGSQALNKKAMTFYPYAGLLEFIPFEKMGNISGNPENVATMLLNQVEVDKLYELVFTNFNGGIFTRYRTGDLIQFTGYKDEEAGIPLPQFTIKGRADKLIDIGNFTRIDEKTIWQALVNSGIQYNDWFARKEIDRGEPVLSVYLDCSNNRNEQSLAELLDNSLRETDPSYKNLREMVSFNPLRLKLLPPGTLSHWEKATLKNGRDFAWVKDQRMQTTDEVIEEILKLVRNQKLQ